MSIKFIEESNMIEGIVDYSEKDQYIAYCNFLKVPELKVVGIINLANELNKSCIDTHRSDPVLRNKKGMNVKVGPHTPLKGGPQVESGLEDLLELMNDGLISSYDGHQHYENLHPLMDCNGRTGRAVWLWMMNKSRPRKHDYNLTRSFLHQWYYQSLDNWRQVTTQS